MLNAKCELTTIIPSYNTGDYILDAVSSIINDVPGSQIIVVDDASTDNTIDVLNLIDYDNLEVIRLTENSPGGAGHPSNIGIESAKGEYIAFVDSDDFFETGYLSKMLDRIKKYQADICIASYILLDTVNHSEFPAYDLDTWVKIQKKRKNGILSKDDYFTLSPEPWKKIYHRSLFEDPDVRFPVNGWFNEDYPFHWFCGLSSSKGICFVANNKYYHRIQRRGQTTESFDHRIFHIFDHTSEIFHFIEKDPGKHKQYDAYLLNWLVIGMWKICMLYESDQEYYPRLRELILSFDIRAVKMFMRIAKPLHVQNYKTICSCDTLASYLKKQTKFQRI